MAAQLWAWRLLTWGVALRVRVKGNGKMDSENIRAYVMKIIMEAQKDGTTAQELADYRIRHGALVDNCPTHLCGPQSLCTQHLHTQLAHSPTRSKNTDAQNDDGFGLAAMQSL